MSSLEDEDFSPKMLKKTRKVRAITACEHHRETRKICPPDCPDRRAPKPSSDVTERADAKRADIVKMLNTAGKRTKDQSKAKATPKNNGARQPPRRRSSGRAVSTSKASSPPTEPPPVKQRTTAKDHNVVVHFSVASETKATSIRALLSAATMPSTPLERSPPRLQPQQLRSPAGVPGPLQAATAAYGPPLVYPPSYAQPPLRSSAVGHPSQWAPTYVQQPVRSPAGVPGQPLVSTAASGQLRSSAIAGGQQQPMSTTASGTQPVHWALANAPQPVGLGYTVVAPDANFAFNAKNGWAREPYELLCGPGGYAELLAGLTGGECMCGRREFRHDDHVVRCIQCGGRYHAACVQLGPNEQLTCIACQAALYNQALDINLQDADLALLHQINTSSDAAFAALQAARPLLPDRSEVLYLNIG
eukprot:TRINITY_DN7380_c0_g1_i1.p1 TRINITY_DN7380_c0_g1~~TRINITY_DN7380_c0_g1_i1.p1  ORF type:complete len:418 (+),score=122.19 TRINITY_DN7380_c0_g1_i1:44-1297(+)